MTQRHNGFETSLIEITVRGEVSSGKSEVLEVIANALNNFYTTNRVKVAGKVCKGAIEEAKTTRQTAKSKNTVFVLYEKMPHQE